MTRASHAKRAKKQAEKFRLQTVKQFAMYVLVKCEPLETELQYLVYAAFLDRCESRNETPIHAPAFHATLHALGYRFARFRFASHKLSAQARIDTALAKLNAVEVAPLPDVRHEPEQREQVGARAEQG